MCHVSILSGFMGHRRVDRGGSNMLQVVGQKYLCFVRISCWLILIHACTHLPNLRGMSFVRFGMWVDFHQHERGLLGAKKNHFDCINNGLFV